MADFEPVDVHPRWIMPRRGKVKINVHGRFFVNALPNGNVSGIGIVVYNSRGKILRMISGSLGIQNHRINEFHALMEGCKCAFVEDGEHFILESDHFEAFWEWRNSLVEGVHPDHEFIVQQLNQRKADPNFDMEPSLCDHNANAIAEYLADYGAHNFKVMVVIAQPFGRIFELWSLDMGLGPSEQRFVAVHEADLVPAVEDGVDAQALMVDNDVQDGQEVQGEDGRVEIVEMLN